MYVTIIPGVWNTVRRFCDNTGIILGMTQLTQPASRVMEYFSWVRDFSLTKHLVIMKRVSNGTNCYIIISILSA